MTEKENKKTERKIAVVEKLPQQEVRVAVGENEEEYELVTVEEAVTEILETVRQIKKSIA